MANEGIKEEKVAEVSADAVAAFFDSTDSTVAVPAGLYYKITPSNGLPISGAAVQGLSTGSADVTGKKPSSSNQGFFKVELSAMPIPAE